MLNILLRLFVNLILFYKNLRESRIFSWFFSPSHDTHQVKKVCFAALTPALGLGDVVLKSSVITYIHQLYPEASIVLVADSGMIEKYKNIYLNHSAINRFIVFPKDENCHPINQVISLIRTLWTIRREQFDLSVTLPIEPPVPKNLEQEDISEWERFIHPFMYLCDIPERIGFCPQGNKVGKFLSKPITLSSTVVDRHWSDYAVACAQVLGAKPDLKPVDLVPFLRFQVEEIAELKVPRPIVAVHAGGDKYWNRRWPLERYQQICLKLCQELKASVYLLGGAEENVENEWIQKNVRAIHPTAHIYTLCGVPLNQTINYINKADLFVGNNSGLMHIAVALNTPSIAIFGPSHSSFWAGDKVDSKHIVLSNNYYCKNGYAWISLACINYCPVSYNYLSNLFNWYPKCLRNISIEAVWSAIEKQLAIVLKEGNTTNDISYKQYS